MNPIRANADYQQFEIEQNGNIANIGPRMSAKMQAIKLPNLDGKEVLDIGCDFGFWSFQSALHGAKKVVGLDRNRPVRNIGQVDLIELNTEVAKSYPVYHNCEFNHINLGKEWREFGKFDVVYLFSLYHHIYQNTGGDHKSIWFWLSKHVKEDGVLIWENPTGNDDVVVRANVDRAYHENYNITEIFLAAGEYFDYEYTGPALHEATRSVFHFYPKKRAKNCCFAKMVDGAGGACKAFAYAENRRCNEFMRIIGIDPVPGSLNMVTDIPFDWDSGYFRSQILDVVDRSKGLDGEWAERWARIYPVSVHGIDAYIFRFEGEKYPYKFVELISDVRLREAIDSKSERITLCR